MPRIRPGRGVAEYGSAIYCGGEPVDLRPPQSAALLDLIRKELSGGSGVEVDLDYRYAVRARSDSGPLSTELIRQIPALSDPDVRIVHGDGQTDVTVAGIDKGTGLAALAALLSDPGCAFAIGDSLPTSRCSPARSWPAHHAMRDSEAPGPIKRTRRAYQAGLSEACTDLLGHRPGGCLVFRP